MVLVVLLELCFGFLEFVPEGLFLFGEALLFRGDGLKSRHVDDTSFLGSGLFLESRIRTLESGACGTCSLLGVQSRFLQEAFGVGEEFFEVLLVGSHESSSGKGHRG